MTPQVPILEQGLLDCINYLSMPLSKQVKYKLIRAALEEADRIDRRFIIENKMRKAQGFPTAKPVQYRPGLSQVFYYCLHAIQGTGNPGPKLVKMQKAIEEEKIFEHFHPIEDHWEASRRGKPPKGPSHKSPSSLTIEDIDPTLIELVDLETIIPETKEEIVPKVTIVTEANRPDGPGLNITLPPSLCATAPADPIGPAAPAPEPYTPD